MLSYFLERYSSCRVYIVLSTEKNVLFNHKIIVTGKMPTPLRDMFGLHYRFEKNMVYIPTEFFYCKQLYFVNMSHKVLHTCKFSGQFINSGLY